ncbi:MAG: AI-2E family transporter [Bacteroidetes bacterium]|nr:AI-2E family transporter [Bacteroidota bacterium]
MNNKNIVSTEVSPVVMVAALIIIMAGMIFAKSIITPFLLALFISIICAQPISWLEKKRLPKWLALIIVIFGLIILFSGFAFLIGGTLSSFSGNVSKYESTLTEISKSFIKFLNEKGLKIPEDQASNLIQPARVLEFTANAVNQVLNMMGNTFLIFLIILFILTEFGSFSIKAKVILSGTDESNSYFSAILKNIRHYLWIKTLVCLSVGILIYVALLIIGVDYPLLWALIAGLMNYIPNIGSIIAAVPAVLFALVQVGLGGAIWTLASFLLVNNVVGNYIEPRVMGKGLGLSTLVVFLSLLFWGFILGPVGMFLSVPLTMTIKIVLEQNEKTRWIAILLGTPDEAEIYLQQKKISEEQLHRKSPLKDK